MTLAARCTPKASLVLTLVWIAALCATGSTEALLFMVPALLIAVPLFCGRYLGEELIAKLVARATRRPKPSRSSGGLQAPPSPITWPARGRDLIAFGLAKRPPPARLLPQT